MTTAINKLNELKDLLHNTNEVEVDCDEFQEKMAWLAETTLSLDLPELRMFLHHIEMCPGCQEEFQLLKEVINNSES